MIRLLFGITIAALASPALAQEGEIVIARVHYGGGGDWYSGPDALPNLIRYAEAHTLLDLADEPAVVELSTDDLERYPVLYLNGHGEVRFEDAEAARLRHYLTHGGFLIINDDYGLDAHIRREMARVFPGQEWVVLPASHPVYHTHFEFPDGLPKIHEHDGRPAQGLGLFHEGRLVVFYAFESDLGDGWEPAGVHDDSPERREAALRMGVNLLVFAMTQGRAL